MGNAHPYRTPFKIPPLDQVERLPTVELEALAEAISVGLALGNLPVATRSVYGALFSTMDRHCAVLARSFASDKSRSATFAGLALALAAMFRNAVPAPWNTIVAGGFFGLAFIQGLWAWYCEREVLRMGRVKDICSEFRRFVQQLPPDEQSGVRVSAEGGNETAAVEIGMVHDEEKRGTR